MYPFITIGWRHIEMTGLWFILWLIIFCIVCYIRSKKMNISFWDMFYALPTMIAIIYFFGSYSYLILNTWHFIPHNIVELSQIIIPPNYNFHAGGIIIGMVLSIIIFIYQQPSSILKKKWIDCLFLSYMNWIIIFGIFLVLGDDMIWLSTDSRLWIYAMTPLSEVAKFSQVYPVWLFVSIIALLSSLITIFIFKKNNNSGWWIIGFWIFFLLLWFVLLFQIYPRHGVIEIWLLTVDINQYIAWWLWLLFIGWYLRNKKNKQKIIRIWN
jgi:hypothetical protein